MVILDMLDPKSLMNELHDVKMVTNVDKKEVEVVPYILPSASV